LDLGQPFGTRFSTLVSTIIQLADMQGEFYEERPAKTFNELVADVGGSLGVVLGLSPRL